MARFELSEQALSDISGILDYTVAQWGHAQAQIYLDALEGRLTQLALRPSLGRRRDELCDELRCLPFESHVIYYVATAFGISVARVLHRRQDPYRHF